MTKLFLHTQQVESVAHPGAPELLVVVLVRQRRAGRPGQAGHPGQPGRQGDIGGGGGQEQAARRQQPLRRPPQLTRRGRRSVASTYGVIHKGYVDLNLASILSCAAVTAHTYCPNRMVEQDRPIHVSDCMNNPVE